jgi:prolyl-tRNA editing enzyme YbaK/EbsC (Cys-tRNA(Pro) deacylase)
VHGVPVSNIVKSLLVKVDGSFKLFLTPGDKRLDMEKVKTDFEAAEVRMANADEVKEITGYSIGGVPPFAHPNKIETHIVEGFDDSIDLVAAAGSGNSVFRIKLSALKDILSK